MLCAMDTIDCIKRVRKSALTLSLMSDSQRNSLLEKIKKALDENRFELKSANEKDINSAREKGISDAVLHRLVFDDQKINSCLDSLSSVIKLECPTGKKLAVRELDEGLILEKVSYPLGVIGMVFEARPDAMVQIISLAIKSGNGIILKGGSEAANTNKALRSVIHSALVDDDYILLLESHSDVDQMLKMEGDIDLIIPRGSNKFVKYCMDNTNIPVMGHADGICSIYVSDKADLDLAINVIVDSKIQYPAACNAVETLLINESIAPSFLPVLRDALVSNGVKIHGDEEVCKYIDVIRATDGEYDMEYLALELNIKIVKTLEEAINHIAMHSSHHTDCIISTDREEQLTFFNCVDSADVFANCSTRFADGFRFGLGAEVGISTGKLHARGPVGLEGLTTYKYQLTGTGQVVKDYTGANAKHFTHRELM